APATSRDATPSVTVAATDANGLPGGTTVALDVDFNDDGDYDDANESDYSTSSLVGGVTTFDVDPELPLGTYAIRARVSDRAGNEGSDTAAVTIEAPAEVVDRHVFYNDSSFDGNDLTANEQDDLAVAGDKTALLPGQPATFANYTSFAKGINGVMVDIAGLANPDNLSDADLTFMVGNGSGWTQAPVPSSLSIEQGPAWDYNVTITWPDNAIENQWLQVTVKATENTGLLEDDIFYFGNAIGEAGDNPLNTIVNATDEIVARNFQHGPLNPASIDDPYDYNRDGLVNGTDQIIARQNQTNPLTMLRLITAPAVDAAVKQAIQESPNAPSAALDWQYEYESMQTKGVKRKDVEATVDLLLATAWQ
ncbi:MAG TPA: hypothetical protein VE890_07410, partial [Thermoguttaceae bacterium]|nr:hypothetical protein [Thermoguttaceae bacterium]